MSKDQRAELARVLDRLDECILEMSDEELEAEDKELGLPSPPDLTNFGARILESTHGAEAYELVARARAMDEQRQARVLRLPPTTDGRKRLYNFLMELKDETGEFRFGKAARLGQDESDDTIAKRLRDWASLGALDDIDLEQFT